VSASGRSEGLWTKTSGGSAVTAAFKRHGSALRAFVSHIVESPADVDDVTHEAFLRAFNAAPWSTTHDWLGIRL